MAALESIKVYGNGSVVSNDHIGMYGSTQYERVYGVKVGSTGATQIEVVLTYTSDGGQHSPSSYAKITDSDACIAPRLNPQISGSTAGVLNLSAGTITYTFTGEFLPNTVYYVHLWSEGPSGTYRWLTVRQEIDGVMCRTAVSESGSYGGLLRVWDESGAEHRCIPYVYDGTQWKQCLAFVGDDSHTWHMGV